MTNHKTLKRSAWWIFVLVCFLSGCAIRRRVEAFNERKTRECLAKHPAGWWVGKKTGLTYTCEPLTYPSCEPGLDGEECGQ